MHSPRTNGEGFKHHVFFGDKGALEPNGGSNRFENVIVELAAILNENRKRRNIVGKLAITFGVRDWRHVFQHFKNAVMTKMEATESKTLRNVVGNSIAGHSSYTAENYVR